MKCDIRTSAYDVVQLLSIRFSCQWVICRSNRRTEPKNWVFGGCSNCLKIAMTGPGCWVSLSSWEIGLFYFTFGRVLMTTAMVLGSIAISLGNDQQATIVAWTARQTLSSVGREHLFVATGSKFLPQHGQWPSHEGDSLLLSCVVSTLSVFMTTALWCITVLQHTQPMEAIQLKRCNLTKTYVSKKRV